MRLFSATFAALALAVVACGGGSSPVTPSSSNDGGSDAAETFAEVKAEDLAALGGAAGSATPDAGKAAPAEPAASAPASSPEPKDECTPVGVDFEQRARPKLKDCYRDGKKKDPNLQGTVKIGVDIDTLGKVKSIKILEKTLPEPVAQCMLKAVKGTPLPDAGKCPGKSFTIPVTFPTPH